MRLSSSLAKWASLREITSIEARVDTIGKRLQILRERLIQRGFEFDQTDEVFPGPEPDALQAIERIESEVGIIPLSLKLFWLRIGSVDFCGCHPEWEIGADGDYSDPVMVYPPSVAVTELEDFLSDKEERIRCDFPYVVPIAPDLHHKTDVSGGMWYNISVPAVTDDPPLNDEWHKTTFLKYLEIAMKWGGFPGLERCQQHNWPIRELVEGL
jgi:hypothetical protein